MDVNSNGMLQFKYEEDPLSINPAEVKAESEIITEPCIKKEPENDFGLQGSPPLIKTLVDIKDEDELCNDLKNIPVEIKLEDVGSDEESCVYKEEEEEIHINDELKNESQISETGGLGIEECIEEAHKTLNKKTEELLSVSQNQRNDEHFLNINRRKHKCPKCKNRFVHLENLKVHFLIHLGEKDCSCKKCGIVFAEKRELIRHVYSHVEKIYSCNDCGKSFKRNDSLKTHTCVHSDEKPYTCKICGISFSNLNDHILVHSAERPHFCPQCGKSFSGMGPLKVHALTHSSEKPYSCNICSKSFAQKTRLKNHMGVHTAKKQSFICSCCNKSFNRKLSYERHIYAHKKEKSYSCKDCGKTYDNKLSLKTHERRHDIEQSFVCLQCDKVYSRKNNLEKHMLLHGVKKTYSCNQCWRTYTKKRKLTKHSRTHINRSAVLVNPIN